MRIKAPIAAPPENNLNFRKGLVCWTAIYARFPLLWKPGLPRSPVLYFETLAQ